MGKKVIQKIAHKKVDTSRHALSLEEQQELDGYRKSLHQILNEFLIEHGLHRTIEKIVHEGESSKFRMVTGSSVEGTLEIDSIMPVRGMMEKAYRKCAKHGKG